MKKINLRLSKLLGIEIFQDEFNGEMVDFIKFPAKVNGVWISPDDRHVINMRLNMTEKAPNAYGQSDYLSICISDPKLRQELIDNGWNDRLKFFGVATDVGNNRMQTSEGRKLVNQNDKMYGMDKIE